MLEACVASQMRVTETSVARTLKLLKKFDEETLLKMQETDLLRLTQLGNKVQPLNTQNWELEKEISELDAKIANLLSLRNRKGGSSVSARPNRGEETSNASPFDGGPNKQELFEQMFALLVHEPRYLAALSHHCPKVDCEDFVKTVVVDLFGGRPGLEVLELRMFEESMRMEFARCQRGEDMGSLFRSGTASMQMLKEYALQGSGKEVIRRILDEPIKSLVEHDLNLEVESIRMYKEFIRKYEKDTQKKWPHDREVSTAEEAFNKKYIQKLYRPRVKQLEFVAEHFLKCVITKHDQLPWGVRWICMKLAELGQEYFPDASPYQWGSIVGGFLFLRLLNPAIIGPQFFNILDKKPSKNTGRTLQFTAKILMKLLNGTQFNEIHMVHLNEFMQRKKEVVQSFIVKLISVPDLQHRMDMYRLMKHNRQSRVKIQTTYNQVILMHRLLVDNKSVWSDPNDPMLKILFQLGPYIPREQRWKRADNRIVTLHLAVPDSFLENDENTGGGMPDSFFQIGHQDDVLRDTFNTLQNFALGVNIDDYDILAKDRGFHQFLEKVTEMDNEDSQAALCVLESLEQAVDHIQRSQGIEMDTTRFLIQYTEQLRNFRGSVKKLASHTKNVEKAYRYIRKHNKFLHQKLRSYQTVFNNIHESTVKSKPRASGVPSEMTQTHDQLDSRGIILWVDPQYIERAQTYCKYTFRRINTGIYEIVVRADMRFFNIEVFQEPIRIEMLELLEMQKRHKDHLSVYDIISLNVNLLIEFLQQTFQDY